MMVFARVFFILVGKGFEVLVFLIWNEMRVFFFCLEVRFGGFERFGFFFFFFFVGFWDVI